MNEEQVHYRGKSILISKTAIVNTAAFIVAVLSEPNYINVLPAWILPLIAIILPPLNVFLRTQTVRPALMIGMNESKSVQVDKLK